jgi:hypothetical protein
MPGDRHATELETRKRVYAAGQLREDGRGHVAKQGGV